MRKIFGSCLVVVVTLSCPALLTEGVASYPGVRVANTQVQLQISRYKSWTRVNQTPLQLPRSLDLDCAAPAPASRMDTPRNPHFRKFFSVYVNETGRDAMMLEVKPKFPQGSIIVKEKLLEKSGGQVELLTAMLKREPGFNVISGDWEYLVLDGTGAKIAARGNLENCQSCHVTKNETDYVFRSYLPDDVRLKLR